MNQTIKNILGSAITVAVLVLAYAGWSYTNSYSRSVQPSSFRSFGVQGEGKVVTVPDIAQLSISVLTEGGKDIAALQTDNTDKVNAIIQFAKDQGVDAKDIKTQSYSIQPRYEYYSCEPVTLSDGIKRSSACPPPSITGYSVNQTVTVKVRDFEKIGTILAGATDRGANSVYGPSFTIDDRYQTETEARTEAIKQAQEKAKAVAEAGGFRLGELLSIDEGGYGPFYYGEAMGKGGDFITSQTAATPPSVEPGSQEITVRVMLRYEIK